MSYTPAKIPWPGPTRNKILWPDPTQKYSLKCSPNLDRFRSGPGKLRVSGCPAGLYYTHLKLQSISIPLAITPGHYTYQNLNVLQTYSGGGGGAHLKRWSHPAVKTPFSCLSCHSLDPQLQHHSVLLTPTLSKTIKFWFLRDNFVN